MSEADRQALWDLPNNRGRDPEIRPQAARWALGRQRDSVHQFVADFQFYVGEVEHQRERILSRLEAQAEAALEAATTANGGRALSRAQHEQVIRTITQQPYAPGGGGGLGHPYPNLTGRGVTRAMRARAIRDMGQPDASGRPHGETLTDAAAAEALSHMTGPYAIVETHLTGALDPATLSARVRAQAATLQFSDARTSAYHAHVHTREIQPADLVPGTNEVETYLSTARETVRVGTASSPARRQDGAWTITFNRGHGAAIVTVTPDGAATLATYIPSKTP